MTNPREDMNLPKVKIIKLIYTEHLEGNGKDLPFFKRAYLHNFDGALVAVETLPEEKIRQFFPEKINRQSPSYICRRGVHDLCEGCGCLCHEKID